MKPETQETLLAELRGLRGDLAEALKHLPRRSDAEASSVVRCGRALDRALLSPPHTFQSVMALVLAQLTPTAPPPTGDEPSKSH